MEDQDISQSANIFDERTKSFSEASNIPPPSWLIKGILMSKETTIIRGPTGSGKSLILAKAAHYLTVECEMPVLYLCGEGLAGQMKRIDTLLCQDNVDAYDEQKQLLDFYLDIFVGSLGLLNNEKYLDNLAEFASRRAYQAIFIDTIQKYKSHDFDENSADIVGVAITSLSSIHCPVLAAIHPGKDLTKKTRGSNAWENDPVLAYELSLDRTNRSITIDATKAKDSDLYTAALSYDIVNQAPVISGKFPPEIYYETDTDQQEAKMDESLHEQLKKQQYEDLKIYLKEEMQFPLIASKIIELAKVFLHNTTSDPSKDFISKDIETSGSHWPRTYRNILGLAYDPSKQTWMAQ